MQRVAARAIHTSLLRRYCLCAPTVLLQHSRTYAAEAEKAAAPPAAPHISALVDQISKLNILEVSELVKALQEKLGLSAGIPMMSAGAPAPAAAAAPKAAEAAPPPAAEVKKEKTEFSVKLTKVADNAKYKIIKELREIKPTLSLMETKSLVEKLPSVLLEKVPKDEATKVIQKLKDAGGECEMIS